MKINPNALSFWAFLFLTGYLLVDLRFGLVCLAAGLGISTLAGVLR